MRHLFFLVCSLVAFVGCEREQFAANGRHEGFWTGAKATDIVFAVGGQPYSVADFETDVRLNLLFLRGKFDESKLKAGFEDQVRKARLESFVPEKLQKFLVRQALERHGRRDVSLDKAVTSEVKEQVARTYGRANESFESVRERIAASGLVSAFDAMVADEIATQTYVRLVRAEAKPVGEKEVDEALARHRKFISEAAEANRKAKALAEDLVRRARAGEDFDKLADAHSQYPERKPGSGSCIGELDADDFKMMQMEDVWNRLLALKVGEVLGPINTEATGGWAIYKVLERIEKNRLTGLPSLRLGEILLREVESFSPVSRENARHTLEERNREELLTERMHQLSTEADVAFPHGLGFLSGQVREFLKATYPKLKEGCGENQ